jgi:hypothetical protein
MRYLYLLVMRYLALILMGLTRIVANVGLMLFGINYFITSIQGLIS